MNTRFEYFFSNLLADSMHLSTSCSAEKFMGPSIAIYILDTFAAMQELIINSKFEYLL